MRILALFIALMMSVLMSVPSYAANDSWSYTHTNPPNEIGTSRVNAWDHGLCDAANYYSEVIRRLCAETRGLPADATWTAIENYDIEFSRRRLNAEDRGLCLDATWGDIINCNLEIRRRLNAEARGLPVDATWVEIENYDEVRRRQIAESLGLPVDATWVEIAHRQLFLHFHDSD